MSQASDREAAAMTHQRNLDRNRAICTAAADAFNMTEGGQDIKVEAAVPAALSSLAEHWRVEATREMSSGRRGAKGRADDLRAAATLALDVAASIRDHGSPGHMPNPNPAREPLTPDEMTATPSTPHQPTTESLDALTGNPGGPITPEVARAMRLSPDPRDAEMHQWPHVAHPDLTSARLMDEASSTEREAPITVINIDAAAVARGLAPHLNREQTPVISDLSDPTPVDQLYASERNADRLTWADLLAAPPASPDHLSHSQMDTLADCALKYRLQRLHGVAERPSWSLVGGNAFHSAVEHIEHRACGYDADGTVPWKDVVATLDAHQIWHAHLHSTIAGVAGSTAIPTDRWHAANKGAEGYTWWLVEGEAMLDRYLDQRGAWGQRYEILRISPNQVGNVPILVGNLPVIEWESTVESIDTMPIEVIVDQAWIERDTGDVVINDIKTGKSKPGGPLQLVIAALALNKALNGPATRWRGQFWSGRSGEAIGVTSDLLAPERLAELTYRVRAAQAVKDAGAYVPRVSYNCVSCSVKASCPTQAE